MSENVGASTSRNPKDLHGLYRDNFTFNVPFFTPFIGVHDQLTYITMPVPQPTYFNPEDG
jgi:hypothetical protein